MLVPVVSFVADASNRRGGDGYHALQGATEHPASLPPEDRVGPDLNPGFSRALDHRRWPDQAGMMATGRVPRPALA